MEPVLWIKKLRGFKGVSLRLINDIGKTDEFNRKISSISACFFR